MTRLLSLFFFVLCFNAGSAQDKVEWSDTTRLQVGDFKASAPNSGELQTVYVSIAIEYQLQNYDLMFTKNFNNKITCNFYPRASWIDSGEQLGVLIRYANTIFDLSELATRKLRKRFTDKRGKALSGKDDLIYQQIMQENTEMQSTYAKETEFGSNEEQQAIWEIKVKNMLEEYSEYCKECKPPRKSKKRRS